MTSAAIDRGASWPERSATLAAFLTLGLTIGTWAAAIPALKLELDLSAGQVSITLLVLAVASVASTLATGALASRFGSGPSTGVTAAVNVLVFATPALARSWFQLTLCAAAIGVAVGAFEVAANAHASDVERRWRSPIMSSFHGAFSVGGLIGAGLGGTVAGAGWGVTAQICIPLAIGVLVLVASTPSLGPGARARTGQAVLLVLPDRRALPLCAIALVCFLLEGAMADWSAIYLETVAGATPGLSAAGYAAFSTAMAVGRFVGDGQVRMLGPQRTVIYGSALAAAGLLLALVVPRPIWGSAGFALVGLGAANIVPVVYSRGGQYGSSPAAGVAVVATCGYAGFLLGPPMIGAVATAAGLQVGMGVVLLMPLLAILASLRMEHASD